MRLTYDVFFFVERPGFHDPDGKLSVLLHRKLVLKVCAVFTVKKLSFVLLSAVYCSSLPLQPKRPVAFYLQPLKPGSQHFSEGSQFSRLFRA